MSSNRDDFTGATIEILKKRAAFICSNPNCRAMTISPSEEDENKFIYIGKAAHITAASEGGPRYDSDLTSEERSSINNGIFLCSSCADMIDKNNGIDFETSLINDWKTQHEEWIRDNLNKKITAEKEVQQVINVTSNNQQGGITAGVVNVSSQPRKFTQEAQSQLLQLLNGKTGQTVTVTCTMGDGEAFSYATQIKTFLESKNFPVNGVNQAVYSQPVMGQNFNPDKLEIVIGTKQ
ncbi:hypothetical protein [Flagellimonas algicola]|uniref:HNH endonuclease n=1 Tax=Flagellimonas algicola TaxID=2583815 RepID=A0ABY2WQ61_9FLAO|nr:hypothetical protein [Allomuricauda algicola]TMU57118.1 hypothetical protein FGG15_06100 [Allomuricauda algicola]